ncbi:hypothetical protein [Rhodococcoides fascians]|uniref:hypothetical protein n=1 Tax=Rhodococcoides fascians TaxID=1828 RepID=UPI001427B211
MPVADNAVDRPLVDVVIDAIDPGDDVSDEAKYYVLAALEWPALHYRSFSTVSRPRTFRSLG